MPKFWQTYEFRRINSSWKEKLAQSGFVDHEDENGELKRPDTRTIGSQNRERTATFYTALSAWLATDPDLPPKHREIFELYATGKRYREIVDAVGYKYASVARVIGNYRRKQTRRHP